MCLGVNVYVYGVYISVHFSMAFDLLKMFYHYTYTVLDYTDTFVSVRLHYFQFLICSRKCLWIIFEKCFRFCMTRNHFVTWMSKLERQIVFRSVVQFLILFTHWIVLEVTDVHCFVQFYFWIVDAFVSNFVRPMCLKSISNNFDLTYFFAPSLCCPFPLPSICSLPCQGDRA